MIELPELPSLAARVTGADLVGRSDAPRTVCHCPVDDVSSARCVNPLPHRAGVCIRDNPGGM